MVRATMQLVSFHLRLAWWGIPLTKSSDMLIIANVVKEVANKLSSTAKTVRTAFSEAWNKTQSQTLFVTLLIAARLKE